MSNRQIEARSEYSDETRVWKIRSLGGIEVRPNQLVYVPEHKRPDTKRSRMIRVTGKPCPSRKGVVVFPSPRSAHGRRTPYVRCKEVTCDQQWG